MVLPLDAYPDIQKFLVSRIKKNFVFSTILEATCAPDIFFLFPPIKSTIYNIIHLHLV